MKHSKAKMISAKPFLMKCPKCNMETDIRIYNTCKYCGELMPQRKL